MRVFFFFSSSNVKQFQEKWSHSLGCLFSVLRKEPISKGKQHSPSTQPALVWRGVLGDKPTLIWHQNTKTPTRDAFSFGDVNEETLAETVRVINIQGNHKSSANMLRWHTSKEATGSHWQSAGTVSKTQGTILFLPPTLLSSFTAQEAIPSQLEFQPGIIYQKLGGDQWAEYGAGDSQQLGAVS